MKPKFAVTQPQAGETVLTCGHIVDGADHYFLHWPKTVMAQGPDGSVPVDWGIACKDCMLSADMDSRKVKWIEYRVWAGSEPCIYEETKH